MVEDGFLVFDGAAIHAPTLLWSEAAAALNQLVWRGDLSDDEADAALQRLLSAPIESHPSADLVTAATRIARRLGWAKTYDAEYLSLSRRLGAPFVTADARLSRAARSVVRVLDPSDLG
jgi:predicted nucleic acid-binding protein